MHKRNWEYSKFAYIVQTSVALAGFNWLHDAEEFAERYSKEHPSKTICIYSVRHRDVYETYYTSAKDLEYVSQLEYLLAS